MTLQEFALRLLSQLQPIVAGVAAAAIVTFAAVIGIYFFAQKSWVPDRSFRMIGLFFGLGNRACIRLASCWLKLVFTMFFVVRFQKLEALHYWVLILTGIIALILETGIRKRLEGLFWLGLQFVGLLSTNLICQFIQEMSGGTVFLLVYIAMGAFLCLFSLYLFFQELDSISDQRDIDVQEVWGTEAE